jgi:hypothetical protein
MIGIMRGSLGRFVHEHHFGKCSTGLHCDCGVFITPCIDTNYTTRAPLRDDGSTKLILVVFNSLYALILQDLRSASR